MAQLFLLHGYLGSVPEAVLCLPGPRKTLIVTIQLGRRGSWCLPEDSPLAGQGSLELASGLLVSGLHRWLGQTDLGCEGCHARTRDPSEASMPQLLSHHSRSEPYFLKTGLILGHKIGSNGFKDEAVLIPSGRFKNA